MFDGLMVVVCLAFSENVIIIANPSKSGGDWWYGKNVSTGKSGLFPKTYVNVVKPCKSLSFYSIRHTILSPMILFDGQQKQRRCTTT